MSQAPTSSTTVLTVWTLLWFRTTPSPCEYHRRTYLARISRAFAR
jgi:hypothetical protein